MSLQELQIRALKDQIINLTRDCHYLISLLNSSDEIDWDNWEQGKKIKEDLERSNVFFNHGEYQEKRFKELDSNLSSKASEVEKKVQELEEFRAKKAAERKEREQRQLRKDLTRLRAEEINRRYHKGECGPFELLSNCFHGVFGDEFDIVGF